MDNLRKEPNAFAVDEYVFSESEDPNQFYFYRKDDKVLGDVGNLPMEMYQLYICHEMFDGNITNMIMNNLCFEPSTDGKSIKITVYDYENKKDNELTDKKTSVSQKIKSIFNKKR